MELPAYSDSVFINCPFDAAYSPMLHALVFTVYACGFTPRSALEEEDSSEMRLDKIMRLIANCKFGIHDISRTEPDGVTGLPRFNMPFELELFWGAKKFGEKQHREKVSLIFEKERYSYQKYISDINGSDIKAHRNDPDLCVWAVRDWLHTNTKRKTIPSAAQIRKIYREFSPEKLPIMLQASHAKLEELTFNDYCTFVVSALEAREQ